MGLLSNLLSPITKLFNGSQETQVTTKATQTSTQNIGITVSPSTTVQSYVDILFDFEELALALESWAINEKDVLEQQIESETLKTKADLWVSALQLGLQQEAMETEKAVGSFLMQSEAEKINLEKSSQAQKEKYLKMASIAALLLIFFRMGN